MSKRILTNREGFKLHDVNNPSPFSDLIRVYGKRYDPCTGLYAVIIADDNLFEGL